MNKIYYYEQCVSLPLLAWYIVTTGIAYQYDQISMLLLKIADALIDSRSSVEQVYGNDEDGRGTGINITQE